MISNVRQNLAFSLTELMIAIVLLGIIATFAVPVYRDYSIRAQVIEVVSLASKDLKQIEKYIIIKGSLSGASKINDLNSNTSYLVTTSDKVSSASMTSSGFTINITGGGLPTGVTIDLRYFYTTTNNSITWFCGYGPTTTNLSDTNVANSDKRYLPKDCAEYLYTAHPNYSVLF